APSPAPMTLMRWRPPSMPEVIVGNLFKQFNELAPRHSITYSGKRLFLFWGQFHEHSDVSICNRRGDLPPEDNYAHERDIARLDFAAVTDHGYNFDPYIWHTMAKIVRSNNDPGRFVTFLGEEWTSDQVRDKSGLGHYGHRNLIFANPRFPRWFNSRDMSKPTDIWAKLRGINFIHIPHQLADTGNCPTDWRYVDEVAQPVAEIFQVRGSYEYEGAPRQAKRTISGHFIQDAWAQGVIIGVIASPDHGGGYGKAGVYAPSLTREAILDAIRQRHTYGTTAAKIVLEMRVNGHLMGEKIKLNAPPKSVKVQVHAIGARDIARVDVCRNNVFIYTRRPNAREVNFIFEDKAPLQSRAYYYVRIIQADEEIAWSSPVWLLP
ncbi:MAG TPA: DUF3604 domain-containing protein, partial [Armatimonadetes bacterium]|nr:DUF3604 domain-containing protein [Armatimonadota bacterium]